MTCDVRERAVLAPPCHPAVDQSRVVGLEIARPDTEPLGNTGAEALDEHVGLGDEHL